jgi:KDO2-lipid IV(A) lauroyltransferase
MKWLENFIFLFPRAFALSLGCFLGKLAYFILIKRRRIAIQNLTHALPCEHPERIIQKAFENMGMNFIELLRLREITAENLSQFVTIHHHEILQEAYQQKKGILALTTHLGNWEILAAAIALSGYQSGLVVKKIRQLAIDRHITALRENKNLTLLSGKNVIKAILKLLKLGSIVGIVLDQHAKASEGVTVSFFGRPASTFKSLAILSERTHAIVLPIYIYRDEKNHHHIVIDPAIKHEASEDIIARTQKYNDWIESAIRKHPEQWMWTHKRWKNNK